MIHNTLFFSFKKMKPSLRSLSELTHYSPATISRALRNSSLVRSDVRRKIIEAARELNYNSTSTRILIICEDISPSIYYSSVLPILSDNLHLLGYTVEMISRKDISLIQDHSVAGAISLVHQDGLEKYWPKNHSIPLVCINTSSSNFDGVHSVMTDDAGGTAFMVEKLISLGHKKIGIYGGGLNSHLGNQYYLKRLKAFKETLHSNNLDDSFVAPNWGEYDPVAIIRPLLDQKITALIGNGEQSSIEIYYALRVLQKQIPNDISVMSWIPENFRHYFFPPLSGVMQDYSKLANKAIHMLMAQISGSVITQDITVPFLFLDGSSIATPTVATNNE